MRGNACDVDVILGCCAVRLPFDLPTPPAPPAIVLRAARAFFGHEKLLKFASDMVINHCVST